MTFHTYDHLDVPERETVMALFHEAFPAGRKPDRIIEATFRKKMGYLHTETESGAIFAMAFSGPLPDVNLLLIDYLAVRPDMRGRGIGQRFVGKIAKWARDEKRMSGLLIEIDAMPGEAYMQRIRFWEKCGFVATDYIHHYKVVPEPYRAMYLPFDPAVKPEDDGRSLFRHIGEYHRKAFAKQ
jgi:GNAT superfamily N-acetyltransferase